MLKGGAPRRVRELLPEFSSSLATQFVVITGPMAGVPERGVLAPPVAQLAVIIGALRTAHSMRRQRVDYLDRGKHLPLRRLSLAMSHAAQLAGGPVVPAPGDMR